MRNKRKVIQRHWVWSYRVWRDRNEKFFLIEAIINAFIIDTFSIIFIKRRKREESRGVFVSLNFKKFDFFITIHKKFSCFHE